MPPLFTKILWKRGSARAVKKSCCQGNLKKKNLSDLDEAARVVWAPPKFGCVIPSPTALAFPEEEWGILLLASPGFSDWKILQVASVPLVEGSESLGHIP